MRRSCDRIIVFENGAQDNSRAWIVREFPAIQRHRSNDQTYGYDGPGHGNSIKGPYTWEPFKHTADGQNEWAKLHVMNGHGQLGQVFPPREMGRRLHFLEGGGTIPWMGLTNDGLTDPEHLNWGGWSGRFSRAKHRNFNSRHQDVRKDEAAYRAFMMYEADSESECWTDPEHDESFNNSYVPVWRFHRAMFNELRARVAWCVQP